MAGIYIHIPFCRSKCIYCDFYSIPRKERMADVTAGIATEYQRRKSELTAPVSTIYFGGGTPSSLPLPMIDDIVKTLPLDEVKEFTIEVNPDDITAEYVAGLAAIGVNRISMGVQSLDDEILRSIGRRHTARQAIEAIDIIHHAGIHNISADLIYGLPGQTDRGWVSDVTSLLATGITHLSAYCLTYHEGTPLYRMAAAGRVIPTDDDTLASRFADLRRITAKAGFHHYEISNFALPGYESRHNSTYWATGGQWIGLGPAAHSFDGKVRRYNPADIGTWLSHMPDPSIIEGETDLDRLNDHIVTALRTAPGLDLATVPPPVAEELIRDAHRFIDAGYMTARDGKLAINPDYWIISDSFIREMIRE